MLPAPTPAAEDAFIEQLRVGSDPEVLVDWVNQAVEARRPQLAARLVSLLPEAFGSEDPMLIRARRAAALMLVAQPAAAAIDEMEEAWRAVRKRRMRRIKGRMRAALRGESVRRRRGDDRRRQ